MALAGLLGADNAMADNAPPVAKAQIQEDYGKLPLYFEANRGQTDRQVKFLNQGRGYSLFLTQTEAVLALSPRPTEGEGQGEGATLRMQFAGANSEAKITGLEKLPGIVNYFIGNDPKEWQTNIPTYAKVRHKNVYPGVDLVYYGNQHQLEYDFVVRPGADPNLIKLAFQGAEDVRIDAQGDLILQVSGGEVRLLKPNVYQTVNGKKQFIDGRYILQASQNDERLTNNVERNLVAVQVGFQVAAYDTSKPLIIDPVLFYSTYLGATGDDFGFSIAVDGSGNAYVTGMTGSIDFPTTLGAFQTTYGGNSDVFVTKLNPTGSGLVYSTYLGGNSADQGNDIAVDAVGNAFLTGYTGSANFPTSAGAFQTTYGGGSLDAFVTMLNPTGSGLVYSTYLGGSDFDGGHGIAVDVAGSAYVAGFTTSTNFPTTLGAFQTALGGSFDAFVTKLNPTGSALVYSTHLGGSDGDIANGIAVDASGDAYVTGITFSTDFPTTLGAFQMAFGGGSFDAFVTKVNPLGTGLAYSTYLGASGDDAGEAIGVDPASNAYVTGVTDSTNFPTTAGAFDQTFNGVFDAFVTKLNPTGAALVYSSYLGGSGTDDGFGVAVDAVGNAFVTGETDSTNFPTVNAVQSVPAGGFDIYVTKVNPSGSGLVYSTYLGGSGTDVAGFKGIALDTLPNPNAYVTGATDSTNFPTTPGAFQPTFGGGFNDAFVAKITEAAVPPGPFTARVTGGGTIDVVGGIGTFSFIIQRAETGELSGQLQYINHASGAQVQSVTYTSLTIIGNTATFDGTCTVDGTPCTFTVNVTDNGEPGTTDTFTISVDGGPTEGGVLRSGNILITQ
jgi:hypothetical protein